MLSIQSLAGQRIGDDQLRVTDLKFLENKGQWHTSILYKADLPGGALYITPKYLGYVFYDRDKLASLQHNHHLSPISPVPEDSTVGVHYFTVEHEGGNTIRNITGIDKTEEYFNYIIGNDPSKWASEVKAFRGVRIHNLYSGIDMIIQAKNGGLKYEYVISPEAKYKDISVKYNGLDQLSLKNEQLVLQTSVAAIVDDKPIGFQGEQEIPCKYVLSDGKVTFKLQRGYDKSEELIIDPQLIFSTSSGSTADNWGNTACLDTSGNLYSGGTVFGTTSSTTGTIDINGFPSSLGAYQPAFLGGNTDMGILKFDSAGTTLLYATYLGGSGTDIPTSTIVSPNNELIILGSTGSADFPLASNAFSGGSGNMVPLAPFGGYSFATGSDIVVTKLNQFGTLCLGSRYMGGTADDGAIVTGTPVVQNYGDQLRGDVNVDATGDIYCISTTASADFPTVGGFQNAYGGGSHDACVFKLSADLTTTIWSTFLGGNSSDCGLSLQLTSTNEVLVAGGTASVDFPVNIGDLTQNGNVDGYVTRMTNDGSTMLASTFIGTPNFDQIYFVQLDALDNPHVLGLTEGVMPVTPGVYFNSLAGQFIQKLTPALDTFQMSMVFGAVNADSADVRTNISPTAFLVNECGNMFVSGWGGQINNAFNTGSIIGMPVTPGAYKPNTDGNDFYLAAIRRDGLALLYGTYFGGTTSLDHVDGGTSRFDKAGIVYQSVCAGCGGQTDFPVVPDDGDQNTFPKTNASANCNNGVFKFDLAQLEALFDVEQESCFDKAIWFDNNSIGGVDFNWSFGDGGTDFTNEPDSVFHEYLIAGTYTITLTATDLTTCVGVAVATAEITIIDSVKTEGDTLVCPGTTVQISGWGPNPPTWDPHPDLSCTFCNQPFVRPFVTTTYYARSIGPNGCENIDSVTVEVYPVESGINDILFTAPRCYDDTVYFSGDVRDNDCICCEPPKSWAWFLEDGTELDGQNPKHQFPGPGDWNVILRTVTNDTLYDTVRVTLYPLDSCMKNIYIPNAFTPNDDLSNDVLYVRGINIIELEFHLFNQTGEEVFATNNLNKGWDGIYKGDKMSQQVFVYTCQAKFWDGSDFYQEGNVTLLE